MGLERGGDRLVGLAQLLERGDEPDGRHPDAAPLLGHEHAEQAELAHLAQEIGRTFLPLPGRRRADRDLLRGELPTQIDQVPLGFGVREIHAPRLLDRSVQTRKWSRCRAERDICSIFRVSRVGQPRCFMYSAAQAGRSAGTVYVDSSLIVAQLAATSSGVGSPDGTYPSVVAMKIREKRPPPAA